MKQQKLSVSKSSGAIRIADSDDDKSNISIDAQEDLQHVQAQRNKHIYTTTNLQTDLVKQISDIEISPLSYDEIKKDIEKFMDIYSSNQQVREAKEDQSYQKTLKGLRSEHTPIADLEIQQLAGRVQSYMMDKQKATQPKDLIKAISELRFLRTQAKMVLSDHSVPLAAQLSVAQGLSNAPHSKKFAKRLRERYQKKKEEARAIIEAKRLMFEEQLSIHQIQARLHISRYQLNAWKRQLFNAAEIQQEQNNQKRRFKKLTQRVRDRIINFVEQAKCPIQAPAIRQELEGKLGFRCSNTLIRNYLKEELDMTYKVIGPITINHNLLQNLEKRQNASSKFLNLFLDGIEIINIDETVIRSTDDRTRGWLAANRRNQVTYQQRLYQTNLIAGVSSKGKCYFTLNRGKTNSYTFLLFLKKLIQFCDGKNPQWRKNTIIMIDNAPYHRSKIVSKFVEDLQIPLMYLGPYQFKMAPVELFFSFVKQRDNNPMRTRLNSGQGNKRNLKYSLGHLQRHFQRNFHLLLHVSTRSGWSGHLSTQWEGLWKL